MSVKVWIVCVLYFLSFHVNCMDMVAQINTDALNPRPALPWTWIWFLFFPFNNCYLASVLFLENVKNTLSFSKKIKLVWAPRKLNAADGIVIVCFSLCSSDMTDNCNFAPSAVVPILKITVHYCKLASDSRVWTTAGRKRIPCHDVGHPAWLL